MTALLVAGGLALLAGGVEGLVRGARGVTVADWGQARAKGDR